MLSVSTAAVHRAIRPKTPESSPSPPSQESRAWNCEYTVFTKRRCRPSPARKKIITDDGTIGIDVHCQTVRFEQTPDVILAECEEFPKKLENSPIEAQEFSSNQPSRSIPFLKSSQMQKYGKISRQCDDDVIEKADEIPLKHDQIEEHEKHEILEDIFEKSVDDETPNTKRRKLEDTSSLLVKKESKMSKALNLLLTRQEQNGEIENDYLDHGVPGIPGTDLSTEERKNVSPAIMDDNGWESESEVMMLRDLPDPVEEPQKNDGFHLDSISQSEKDDKPYYMIGFPNPPGENRCWLNATLHAIFALPFIDHMEQLDSKDLRNCSRLTRMLIALRLFWSRGYEDKQKTFQTIKLFKESLNILDESYPSERQQDVSEFLTIFLNYIKTDFERNSTSTNRIIEETDENMTENRQETRITHAPQTPNKRPPLADISPCKRQFDQTMESSPKSRNNYLTYSVRDLMSPRLNRLTNPTDPAYKVHTPPQNRHKGPKEDTENLEFEKNPIDRYFLLHMMEHYVCKGCAKHRQRKVDNLMIYVDLLADNENEVVSLDKMIKKTQEPEERTLTCGKCKYDKHTVFTTYRFCPKILMVQVNRYGMCGDGSVAKFNTPVDIPASLDIDLGMSNGDDGKCMVENFEPVCVIAHVGSAMDCGHYTSYVKHGENWYHYNDLMVTPMSKDEALAAAQTTAYVVFFASTKL